MRTSRGAFLGIALSLAALLWRFGLLDARKLALGASNLSTLLYSMFPPSLTVLPPILWALLETVQMAYAGTLLGFAMALPLCLASSNILFSPGVTMPARALLGLIRTIPSLLWALIFVIILGLGPTAGVLGVAFYTLGYLGKLYFEAFDSVEPEVIEAVKSVTRSRLFLARYAIIPASANYILSQLLFMFEYNIRASAIMGFVGAGGIGFLMLNYVEALQYDRLTTALLATLALVLAFELVSGRIRARYLPSRLG